MRSTIDVFHPAFGIDFGLLHKLSGLLLRVLDDLFGLFADVLGLARGDFALFGIAGRAPLRHRAGDDGVGALIFCFWRRRRGSPLPHLSSTETLSRTPLCPS